MIPVADAMARILADVLGTTPEETIPVARGLGRVLARDVAAPFDVPPADNSAVDGYAVRAADLAPSGRARLRVVADLPAGAVYAGSLEPTRGAPHHDRRADAPRRGHRGPQGAQPRRGRRASSSERSSPARTSGHAARTCGRARWCCGRDPCCARRTWVSSRRSASPTSASIGDRASPSCPPGDEVVEPGRPRRPGQIYDANRFSLGAMVESAGADAGSTSGSCPTGGRSSASASSRRRPARDVVLTSGGVSVGDYDLVKSVLGEIGGVDFWQVAMQPGRPLAVGRIAGAQFFGLPGNPVASVLCFHLFVRPALWKLGGRARLEPECVTAAAAEPMRKKAGRREFKRGVLRFTDRGFEVSTTGPQGSGILSSMVAANCLIILEEDRGDIGIGERVLVEPF